MKYRLSDLPLMLSTSLGRAQLLDGIQNVLWPVFYWIAKSYRILTSCFTRQIVVVGSLGKTTSCRVSASVLGLNSRRKCYRNFRTHVARQILRVPPWHRYAVTEVGIDGPGQMAQFAGMVKPCIVIVTSIRTEHNRSLKSLETTRFEKSMMLRNLSGDGLAIINGDDPNVLWMRTQTEARVATYGFSDFCEFKAWNYRLDWPHGSSFEIDSPSGTKRVKTRLIGRHMVYPVLAAVALAEYTGVTLELALSRLESLEPASGRLETVHLPGGAYLIRDDFKSSIESIHSALDVLEMVPAGRRGIILGDISEPPGPQGPLYRGLGRRIAGIADWVVFYGNKRGAYAAGAHEAGMPKESVERARNDDLAGIARRVLQKLEPGDVVLVKGRDTQRLDRISLALQGENVKCDIRFCDARVYRCDSCPMLRAGWGNRKVVI